jgi:NAD(P)H-dependent FMN reductase
MMSLLSLSTSSAPNSLNYRGLLLLNELVDLGVIDGLHNYNLPVVNVNGMDETIPSEVQKIIDYMYKFDKFIFTIPEFTGMMSASTKNLLDWLVVASNMNLNHGKGYPFTDKYVMLFTFTPSGYEGGSRHMTQTKEIFKKLGANVIHTEVFTYGWKNVIPGNTKPFREAADRINNYLNYKPDQSKAFAEKYNEWDTKWK